MNELMFFVVNCVTDCGGADILRIIKFVFILLDLVFFIVPIGLIIMIMVDFSKNVIASKEDEMKKNLNIAIKRIIYCVALFLVPTIVNFAIGLVSDIGITAATCIEIAKNEKDLEKCAINYETFDPMYPDDVYYDEVDTKNECYVCNFSDGRPSIYVWDTKKPINNYGGCTSKFKLDTSKITKSACKEPIKSCFKCLDGTGYVSSSSKPSSGFKYTPDNSYNYKTTACGSGFYDKPVADCNCTTTGCSAE